MSSHNFVKRNRELGKESNKVAYLCRSDYDEISIGSDGFSWL